MPSGEIELTGFDVGVNEENGRRVAVGERVSFSTLAQAVSV